MTENEARQYVYNIGYTEDSNCIKFSMSHDSNGRTFSKFKRPERFPFVMLNPNGYLRFATAAECRQQIPNYNNPVNFSINGEINSIPGFKSFYGSTVSENCLDAFVDLDESNWEFNPNNSEEGRKFINITIALRQGQPDFRNRLLDAYSNKCAVTGCDVVASLEAAHIIPYKGLETNHVQNGLLLRADIHTLFDRKLLAIDINHKISLHPDLKNSHYGELHNKAIELPIDVANRPNKEALATHKAGSGF